MKKIFNEKKAITLIALVISIIVIIILAGVTINTLINNGIIDKAKTAKEQYQNAQEDEENKISQYNNNIDSILGSRDKKIEVVDAYIASNSTLVGTISLGNYNLSDYDFMLVTSGYPTGGYTITNYYYIKNLKIGESKIGNGDSSGWYWYTITDEKTLTKHSGSTYYISAIQLIKI